LRKLDVVSGGTGVNLVIVEDIKNRCCCIFSKRCWHAKEESSLAALRDFPIVLRDITLIVCNTFERNNYIYIYTTCECVALTILITCATICSAIGLFHLRLDIFYVQLVFFFSFRLDIFICFKNSTKICSQDWKARSAIHTPLRKVQIEILSKSSVAKMGGLKAILLS
jgi:hypothetical protein